VIDVLMGWAFQRGQAHAADYIQNDMFRGVHHDPSWLTTTTGTKLLRIQARTNGCRWCV